MHPMKWKELDQHKTKQNNNNNPKANDDYLGGNTSNIEASSAKSSTLFDTGGFEAKLSGLDGGDIATGATTDDDDVVVIESWGSKTSGEWCKWKRIVEGFRGRKREVSV